MENGSGNTNVAENSTKYHQAHTMQEYNQVWTVYMEVIGLLVH